VPLETNFDTAFVAQLALREKQIQQSYRPIIGVHKWFARRPGTLFRSLLLAEYIDAPLAKAYFEPQDLSDKTIADPFMGGGTPLFEANRVGMTTIGWDINPMAYWIVRQSLQELDLVAYLTATEQIRRNLAQAVGHLYATTCLNCNNQAASIKCALWVKTLDSCDGCNRSIDLFPGYLVAQNVRHPANVLVCPNCEQLNEVPDRRRPGSCTFCQQQLQLLGNAARGTAICKHCGHANRYPRPELGPPQHRMFAIEYHCGNCSPGRPGRRFKVPDAEDLATYESIPMALPEHLHRWLPEESISLGKETQRPLRWGYRIFGDLFNRRQAFALAVLADLVAAEEGGSLREALATNLSDLVRYQNMLCRYDTMALKALDIFSIHGYPVGLIQCESNAIGIRKGRTNIGSGGWTNIVDKYLKAKAYCADPFEVLHKGGRKQVVSMRPERMALGAEQHRTTLVCGSSTELNLPVGSLDGVFTDPPYAGNVQYAELMDMCFVWLKRLLREDHPEFVLSTTFHGAELTENHSAGRDVEHFTTGLSEVLRRCARALRDDAPLAFTYHHNQLAAYLPVIVAILNAGLTCTAALAAPAEMGASIHISGTKSSVVDSVFVCRKIPAAARGSFELAVGSVAADVVVDIRELRQGGVRGTAGDIRCITYGHLARRAVHHLCPAWSAGNDTAAQLRQVDAWLQGAFPPRVVEEIVRNAAELATTSEDHE
jgi:putative DNA methylase